MLSKFSEEAQKVLISAKFEMSDLRHPYVGSEHLLLSILKENNDISERFKKYGITYQIFRNELIKIVGVGNSDSNYFLFTNLLNRIIENSTIICKDLSCNEVSVLHLVIAFFEESDGVAFRILSSLDVDFPQLYEEFSIKNVMKKDKMKRKLLIEDFGIDLTKKASDGEIDSVIGRDEEISQLIQVLCRKNKNNPLLLGEAGVGKTSIVEELARRIVNGDVPLLLRGKRVISIYVSSLVAGTKYRGEFEERINKILKELENRDDVILFVDEVHTLVGAGGADGAIDASNILKPSLARGKIKLIGATTIEEYKKTIEKDKAFDRRFHKIKIDEPNLEKTYDILCGLKELYCSFHHVSIDNDVLKYLIRLTDEYIYNRYQPDKSIDILDEVCVKVGLKNKEKNSKFNKLKIQLENNVNLKNQCILNQDFDLAINYGNKIKRIQSKINKMNIYAGLDDVISITKDDIKEVVSKKTGIPIYDCESELNVKLKNIESSLNKIIVGQEEPIRVICNSIKKSKLGFNNLEKPSSFLFVGPSGVGKTSLVKEIAKQLNDCHFIRLDMSEYRESHTASKILGSPAGYVGYEDNKNILEEVRENPYSIILLDEIEKAHPAILNLFLQILDEGCIKDSSGRNIKFNHSIIVMTSNAGFEKNNIGFNEEERNLPSNLNSYFKVEFLNRIDNIITFDHISEVDAFKIVERKIKNVRNKFKKYNIRIKISKHVINEIISLSDINIYGARRFDKIIDDKIGSLIIDNYLNNCKNVCIDTILV